ncbi:hypothetical protein FOCC_FOCC000535 [Frankliniella occidentalis]|uniref:Uncharacterized protein LOC113204632 n=1 Tax=Frankliniella occidentalis TaxID=133901 RepID=A0A6J1S4Q9_FRAOC|nr:uncharacterized protein LOC113204632 [Frankliniella occidentalis]KAE8752797.1 hypothetical protein FOCC_FOCC000535 [Frankliniella occidentalis]
MAGLCFPIRSVPLCCHNLKALKRSCLLNFNVSKEHIGRLENYSTESKKANQPDFEEKKKKFRELEDQYRKMLCIENLTTEERRIHVLHAEAVAKGHFTYDDPWLNEKVLTRLRHYLKGKCCGKSCRHCIYEHSSVVDEKQKARARFNSSFWVYDKEEEDDVTAFDEQHVVTYGRGPYPRKYAENAPENMIKIPIKP